MAEQNDKSNQTQSPGKQSEQQRQSNQSSGHESGSSQGAGQGQRGSRMARHGSSIFSLSPSAVFRMGPFELMRRFTDELDHAFEGLGLTRGGGEIEKWTPSVEICERDNNLVVRAELPGLDSKDVKVEMTDDGLIIQGEKKREHEERQEGFHKSERVYGQFYRHIPLPEGAEVDQAKAQINNGVLEVVIPMSEERRKPRSIPVESGSGKTTQTAGGQTQAATGEKK